MCVKTTKVRRFMNMKKTVQIEHKKYGKGGHRNLLDHLKLIFRCNPRSRSGFEVCPPAPQHVLDVPLPYFPKLTI